MPIDQADLPEPEDQPEGGAEGGGESQATAKPRIAEWVTELPRPRRTTDYDTVIEEIRGGEVGAWARLETGTKLITANKISTLKKRYEDIEFRQVGGQTYAAKKA